MSLLGRTCLLACLPVLLAAPAAAETSGQSPWQVRLRGIYVVPDEDADIDVIGGDADIDNAVMPEIDISYFLSETIALELILATTPHDVEAEGTALGDVDLGDVWLLPPTLLLQYHPLPHAQWRPYVGVGLNYTIFYGVDEAGGIAEDVDYDNSIGYALQAGLDVPLQGNWMINLDVKKLWLNTDVEINHGAVDADVDIDPWIFGVGVGYRF